MAKPVPFSKCWWVTDHLLAGPAFFAGSSAALTENMDALESAGITDIVSLVSVEEFFLDEDEADAVIEQIHERFFIWHGFAIPDGSAPDKSTTQVILGWIDAGLRPRAKVFVHCLAGRGRTGTAIGCWLARHGIAQGESVIELLAMLRRAAGLRGDCPETRPQRERVTRWRVGE
jgi:protein-tyrosine phosphatase